MMVKILFTIIVLFLMGCASVGSVKSAYKIIDYSDGVSKKEAVIIAKEHLINTKYHRRYQVIGPRVEDAPSEGDWLVRFYGKKTSISEFYMPSVYEVAVDKKTGKCTFKFTNNNTEIR